MTSVTTKPNSSHPTGETAVYLFDNWFDPIEGGLRDGMLSGNWGCGTAMINVVNDGRLFSLQAAEWLMLIGGGLAGLLILMI